MEIVQTRRNKPPRILIHADHGLGKSSLAAAAPAPIFIQTEDGMDNIDAQALPFCDTFEMFIAHLDTVREAQHDFQSLAVDSLDWLERLIIDYVCRQGNKKSISDFSYGAGYQMVLDNFNLVIERLGMIRDQRGMIIFLIAHSQVRTLQNPLGADYDRYQIKLREKNAELFQEWVDVLGYMRFQTFVKVEDKGGFGGSSSKAVGGSERILSVYPNAAWVAKNRYGIKDDIPMPAPEVGALPTAAWTNLVNAITGGVNNG